MLKSAFLTLLFSLWAIFSAPCTYGAQMYQPGFKTIGGWLLEQNLRLDLNIWYPAVRQAQELNFSPWKIRGALNAKPAQGTFPLIILSHPSSGNRFSFAALGAWLASRGYVCAAPTHAHDNLDNMDDLFTWAQLLNRANEISRTIDVVLDDKLLEGAIDSGRIGIAGFGSGAAAALLLGGALPDCSQWKTHCQKAGPNNPYCSQFARDRLDRLCAGLPLKKSLANPGIKAIAAIAPGFGWLFGADSFKFFHPPILIVTAKQDQFNNPAMHSEYLARILGRKAHYLTLPDADMPALMDECPSALAAELPELCESASRQVRRELRGKLESSLLSFFNYYLLEHLQDIPPPPDLSPPKEEQKEEPTPQKPKKRRAR